MMLDPFKRYMDDAGDVWSYDGSSWAWDDPRHPGVGTDGYNEEFVLSCGVTRDREMSDDPAGEANAYRALRLAKEAALLEAKQQRDDALAELAKLQMSSGQVVYWGIASRGFPVGTVVRDADLDLYAKLYGGAWVVLESPNATAYVGTQDPTRDLVEPITVISTPNG